jgi:hypothetical protein
MRNLFVLSSIVALSFISSCSNDKADDSNPCAYDASQLKYNGFIKTIINTNCASDGACHGTPQAQDAGGEYLTYDQVKAKIDNGAFRNRVFDLKDMPQGSALSECDFKKLKDWVDAGAPQ